MDSIEMLKELSLLIRNATKSGENTAERVGRTFVGIVDILSTVTLDKLRKIFLQKDCEDETKYLLKLLGGIISPFLESPDFVTGMMGAGMSFSSEKGGESVGWIDKLYVRKKAIFQLLSIMETELAGASFMFNASGARAKITKVELVEKKGLRFKDNKAVRFSDGKRGCASPGTYGSVYRCYFLADDGDTAIENRFKPGNLARSQSFNIKEGVHEGVSNHYWWRLVENVGEITEQAKNSEFKVFRSATELPDGKVVAMNVPHAASMPRSEIDSYTEFVKIYGAKGLAYIKVNEKEKGREGLQSPIVKNLSDELLAHILEVTGAQNGDVIFFGADRAKIVYDSLGALRLKIGHSDFGKANGLYEEGWKALWVVDFPMFEYDDEEHRWVACHHPFTMPHPDHIDMLSTDPGKCLAQAYDMVLNGWEIGGGSIRIHRADIQSKVFNALNIGPEEARAKFGFLLDNLQYGAPPHGGIAFGLDRIVTIMAGAPSIRDVIAFPKTQRAQCLLTNAPAPVEEKQLRELHIRLRNPQPSKE